MDQRHECLPPLAVRVSLVRGRSEKGLTGGALQNDRAAELLVNKKKKNTEKPFLATKTRRHKDTATTNFSNYTNFPLSTTKAQKHEEM
jgi:hypothetical protein